MFIEIQQILISRNLNQRSRAIKDIKELHLNFLL